MKKPLAFLGFLSVVIGMLAACSEREKEAVSELMQPRGDQAAAKSTQGKPALAAPRLGKADFVGSEACAACHQPQAEAYRSSHHAKALVVPSDAVARERFAHAQFKTKHGGLTKFSHDAQGASVTTPLPGGKTQRFPITHISGVWPLEQYVVATERGKLQALSVAWDSRDHAEGGQRWFHIYGQNGVAPVDPLYFTQPAQNWNHMCAECHSTWVERRYDVEADRFDTAWAELSVGCEACHGPGAAHVRSAQAKEAVIAPLSVRFAKSSPWLPSGTGSPVPHVQDGVQAEVCAPCHSRREPLKEGFLASDALLDAFEPELLWPGRYHADGQVEGEVYEWASFQQSRMFQAGVQCSDCHNPHSGKLHAEDNDLCVRCHESERFHAPSHTHHPVGKAPLCIDCHMPPSTFMQIDERRDHSIRIPRPDHSVAHGTPNACNTCHTKESAAWARHHVRAWFPHLESRPHFVDALAKDRKGALDAPSALRKLAEDATSPAVARATALERLSQYPTPKSLQTLQTALRSREALLVYGAVLGTAQWPLKQRLPLLLSVLEHPARAVRVAVAKQLAAAPPSEIPPSAQAALQRAFREALDSFAVSASRPETHVEQSAFELARGDVQAAERSLARALKLQPCLAEAHLNRAELARQRGDEAAAEREIREAIQCSPQNAAAHHALGLWQVRARQAQQAVESLQKATQLAPNDARFRYVYAVALAGGGERDAAMRVLEASLAQRPSDSHALQALASYLHEAGQRERALEIRAQLERLLRD